MTYSQSMSNRKTLLIYNATACKGKAGERKAEIEAILRSRGLEHETRMTTAVWHAAELARESPDEGFDELLVAGGDGTMNEVVNGLMLARAEGKKLPTLGIIPVGRGNDFSHGMGVPGSVEEAADLIAGRIGMPLDIGFVRGGDYPEGRYFGNGLGVGFDARVGFEAAKMKKVRGSAAYTFGALKIFASFPAPVAVHLHSEALDFEGSCHQISIMNGCRMGGAYYMAPGALVDDGLLNLCIVGDVNRFQMAALIMRYTKGSQEGQPKVMMAKAASISIEAPKGGLAVHADGETICTDGHSIVVECRAAALSAYKPGR